MRQRVLQATIITVTLVVLMLGIPLGVSWLNLNGQTLSNQTSVILDQVRVDTETRLQEGLEIDEALLQRRVDEQAEPEHRDRGHLRGEVTYVRWRAGRSRTPEQLRPTGAAGQSVSVSFRSPTCARTLRAHGC